MKIPIRSLFLRWRYLVTFALFGAFCYFVWKYETIQTLIGMINENTPPALFLVLLAILPLVGFPISLFIVLAAIKFAPLNGLLLMGGAVIFHMGVSYLLAHSVMRPLLEKLLDRWEYSLPTIPNRKAALFTLFFTALPGLPYTAKNYILPLSGVPLKYYFLIAWPIQLLWTLPFLGLGGYVHGILFH